ncbi:hypothetical protein ATJ88_0962 [Isoptericola jiangsuensis]|uniref:Uncharacterized protein n=1 Tax=Isoptericola jiangsuensis TaxID=548579 RepID=A0A2A9EVN5_9MICO|nr:hypothetical protein [Isoptericola jiangsuensis]PFG42305.1 hypothetical protein ATJ88_0962 [Isoptericola jiangsuensis]
MTAPDDVESISDAEVADGYFRFLTLFHGDRAARLASEELSHFYDAVWDRAVFSADPFPMLGALIDRATDDELGQVGEGVIESMIDLPQHWPGLEERCRLEPRWRAALRCVCADADLVARMPPVLRETLTHDPWEFVDLTGLPEDGEHEEAEEHGQRGRRGKRKDRAPQRRRRTRGR